MSGLVYFFHGIFWSAFVVRFLRPRGEDDDASGPRSSGGVRRARHPFLLLAFHGFAFGAMYQQLLPAVAFPERHRMFFPSLWPLGALVILAGAGLLGWALWVFGSWRLLAKIGAEHRLCTDGPYQWVRHPIYVACDLLALGTFLWVPTIGMCAALLMLVSGHVRMLGEEKVLLDAFGEEYRDYRRQTKRYVPGVI